MADATEVKPGTSSKPDSAEDNKESTEAYELLAKGKRDLFCREVPQACQSLQEACRLLAKVYGEVGNECGEAYLSYGAALLDLSRMESGVLGNALKGIASESEEEESVSSDDKVEDPEKVTDDETEKEETDKDDEESLDTEEDNAEGEENADEEMPEDKEADSSQEDVSNLQLAWEVLELAKMIYSKQEGKESQLKAADACLKLGEVGLETEQYETAINDFQSCLKIQQEFLEPESRLIAETHYQIGLACTFACRYTEAIDNYRLAVKVIESKINLLKSEIEESEKSGKHKELGSFNEVAIQKEKEIKDLSEILPDIRAKLEDTEDEMKSQDKLKEMVKESVTADAATTIGFGNDKSKESPKKSSDAAGPVSDISHMVRKKRKADDDAKEEESSKKPCSEDIKAGGDNATTNGQINGKKPETAETNGKQNGVNGSNGTTSPEKMETEIKTKTVEDVKKASEETA